MGFDGCQSMSVGFGLSVRLPKDCSEWCFLPLFVGASLRSKVSIGAPSEYDPYTPLTVGHLRRAMAVEQNAEVLALYQMLDDALCEDGPVADEVNLDEALPDLFLDRCEDTEEMADRVLVSSVLGTDDHDLRWTFFSQTVSDDDGSTCESEWVLALTVGELSLHHRWVRGWKYANSIVQGVWAEQLKDPRAVAARARAFEVAPRVRLVALEEQADFLTVEREARARSDMAKVVRALRLRAEWDAPGWLCVCQG